jgi:hypothetical protein
MQRLDRLTIAQIAAAVEASGGTPEEVTCFSHALRARLDRLRDVGANAAAVPPEVGVATGP